MKRILSYITIFVLFLALSTFAHNADDERTEVFNCDFTGVGELQDGLSKWSGIWQTKPSGSAVSKPHILDHPSQSEDTVHPIHFLVTRRPLTPEVHLAAQIRFPGNSKSGYTGFFFNSTDTSEYLAVRLFPSSQKIDIIKFKDGKTKVFKTVSVTGNMADWHRFTVEYNLKTVQVLWELQPVMEIDIDSPVSGDIGILCTANLESNYDDIAVVH